jgi:hypothetical protein
MRADEREREREDNSSVETTADDDDSTHSLSSRIMLGCLIMV